MGRSARQVGDLDDEAAGRRLVEHLDGRLDATAADTVPLGRIRAEPRSHVLRADGDEPRGRCIGFLVGALRGSTGSASAGGRHICKIRP